MYARRTAQKCSSLKIKYSGTTLIYKTAHYTNAGHVCFATILKYRHTI